MNDDAPSPTPFDPTTGNQRQARRHWWRYGAGLALLGLIGVGLWPQPLPVETAEAVQGPLRVTVNEEGVTQVRYRYVVSAPVSGSLRRIDLKAGAAVVAGQTVVAVLEPAAADILDVRSRAQAEARVRAAESQVKRAEANRERAFSEAGFAQSEASRARVLARDGLVSHQDLDTAENRERTALQEDRAATFALQIARYELEQVRALLVRGSGADSVAALDSLMEIKSPVSGRVLRVFQESARVVTGGVALLEVGDPTDLEIRVEVLSRDGVAIQPGASVELEQWGGIQPLEARVRWIEPAAFTKVSALGVEEQRVNVLADLLSPVEARPSLGDGYRVEARIERARRDSVIQVPAGALFQRGDSWTVFVVENGKAMIRSVNVGLSDGIGTEVTGGLAIGETVVLYPGDRISDGASVALLGGDDR